MSESEICLKIAHYVIGQIMLVLKYRPSHVMLRGRMTKLIKLAQQTNVRELETVDMPVYIRSKRTKQYMRLLVYNIIILTRIDLTV